MSAQYDAAILGFGKAGKTIAAKLAAEGRRVVLVEKDAAMYGGTCINVGCIPSKRLVMEAASAPEGDWEARRAYYRSAIEGKRALTGALNAANYRKLINAGVTVLDGIASFASAKEIIVTKADGTQESLQAERIVINTGAEAFIPPIPGIENNDRIYTGETLLDLAELPKHLVIIGGGYIGLEFASIYADFGSKVTVIQIEDTFIPREDADIADSIQGVLEKKGVTIVKSAQTKEFKGGTVVYLRDGQLQEVSGDAILVAVGRRPNVRELHVEAAGIALTERGAVATDEHLRTNVADIWAAGDVCGNLQFTYISLDDSRIILDDMRGNAVRTTQNRGAFAYAVFLDPPFARVGLNEKETAQKEIPYRVVRMDTAAIPKAKVLKKTEGMLKALIDDNTGKILGVELFCAEAHELINMLKLAIDQGVDYTVIRDFIFTHPTMAEGLNDLFAL